MSQINISNTPNLQTTKKNGKAPRKAKQQQRKRKNAQQPYKAPKQRSKNMSLTKRNIPPLNCYSDLLNDPFNTPPCRIGYGTMVHTEVGTMILRQTFTTNADGSFAIVMMPFIGSTNLPITVSTGLIGVVAWASSAFSNIGQYPNTILSECRVIASGLKVTPLIAATVAPGTVYAGAVDGRDQAAFTLNTPQIISTWPALRPFINRSETVKVTSRPTDLSAYEFRISDYTGANNVVYNNSACAMVLAGFPIGASIIVECVLHFEYIPVPSVTTVRDNVLTTEDDTPKITSSFPSFEKLWEYTRQRLDPSAVFDLAHTAGDIYFSNTLRHRRGGNQNYLRLENYG